MRGDDPPHADGVHIIVMAPEGHASAEVTFLLLLVALIFHDWDVSYAAQTTLTFETDDRHVMALCAPTTGVYTAASE